MTGVHRTHVDDLPDALLTLILSAVADVRSRNVAALVSRRWRSVERSTRAALSLRGNARDLFLLPACFSSVSLLDLSLLSPWGHRLLPHADDRLRSAFPNASDLTIYARDSPLAFPNLRSAALVRWHKRPQNAPGADLAVLFSACPGLESLDLSRFYCYAEDIPAALSAHSQTSTSLRRLNFLNPAIADGFRSSEILAVASNCPNLAEFLAPCVFNPRHLDFVGDSSLLALATSCPKLSLLHLADPSALSSARSTASNNPIPAGITAAGLSSLFAALPNLEHLALDLCHVVKSVSPAMEALRVRSLKLGCLDGVCIAAGLYLDGVAVLGRLERLCIKNCSDLTDAGLVAIARGCCRLSKLEIHGCGGIGEGGMKKLASMLRSTLLEVSISDCRNLDTRLSLSALEPIRDRIERLHIDCVWTRPGIKQSSHSIPDKEPNKKCRLSSDCVEEADGEFWCRRWDRLKFLSLWVPAGEVLSPLLETGLEDCPNLEEMSIKVEGDCRTCPRPAQSVFGLSSLALYPRLTKMKLDCGDAIGYALTAPRGHIDLSLWERFYLNGIGELDYLYELDYWPPQDNEVNQRSLSLPATSLIQGCLMLRKLFIHGTAHEHFIRFFLEMPRLRDFQLREDYYPAPEDDMSTEMRIGSCSRFEDALNSRIIPD